MNLEVPMEDGAGEEASAAIEVAAEVFDRDGTLGAEDEGTGGHAARATRKRVNLSGDIGQAATLGAGVSVSLPRRD